MKQTVMVLLGVVVLTLLLAGLTGFSFFSKRLTESKNIKELESNSPETSALRRSAEIQESLGAVESGLQVQIISPSHQSIVTSAYVTLRGKTVAKAEVFVNDKETVADAQGNFSLGMTLEEGENPIIVVANDQYGNVGEAELSIIYDIAQ